MNRFLLGFSPFLALSPTCAPVHTFPEARRRKGWQHFTMMRICSALPVLGLLFVASDALADPIATDFATGVAHAALAVLFIIAIVNLLIAGLEGAVVAGAFRLNGTRTFWIMLLANMASGFLGLIGSSMAVGMAARLAIYYMLTVLVEWPFLWWAVDKRPKRTRDAWKASFLAQSVSYGILLLPLIWWNELTSPW